MINDVQSVGWPGWKVTRLIGRGSFGAVYEMHRSVFSDVEKAALKVITIPQAGTDIEEMYSEGYDDQTISVVFQKHLESIVAEYSMMKKMNGSHNIVNCDDIRYVQHEDGIGWDIFIKMELLTPLGKALSKDISEETVIKIGIDMCAALELCKQHGIIHRDIKPQNIFVSPYGDYKLGDFGIAKTVERTMGGTKIGTYKFMAPEVHNNQPYGAGADLYSLGLVLYWLLNERRTPFLPLPPQLPTTKMEDESRRRRFSGEQLPKPAHGSHDLQSVVLKACAFDPKNRYASAEEMLHDLNSIVCEKQLATNGITNFDDVDTDKNEELTVDSVASEKELFLENLENGETVGPIFRAKEDGSSFAADVKNAMQNKFAIDNVSEELPSKKERIAQRWKNIKPSIAAAIGIVLLIAIGIIVGVCGFPSAQSEELSITRQPHDVEVASGETALVSFQASGENLTYEWYYKNHGEEMFSKTDSSTNNKYTINEMSKARDGRQLYCKVTDARGNSITTNTVTIRLADPIVIVTQPKSVTVAEGERVVIEVIASGVGLTYEWYFKNAGDKKFTKSDASSDKQYIITQMSEARDGRRLFCRITDVDGNEVDTEVVTLKMK